MRQIASQPSLRGMKRARPTLSTSPKHLVAACPQRVKFGCSCCGLHYPALGRRLALAISMNERLLTDVVLSKPAVPVSASTCHSIACLNVREGSRPAVRGK
jgi:hypothetical protein